MRGAHSRERRKAGGKTMLLYSDTLTKADLYAALPAGVDAYVTQKKARKRDHAFDVTLYVYERDELHRRAGNSGGYGSSSDIAATWDDWGIWMWNLYQRDPDAIIGWYKSPSHFLEVTRKERDRIRQWNKPESLQVRTHTAPWLDTATVEA
jgi:hypothetical protein